MADKTTDAPRVLDAIRGGLSLRRACLETGVAQSSFLRWCDQDADLADQYARARDSMIDAIADETIAIADKLPGLNPTTGAVDSAEVAHRKLQVDTRKWLLSKLAPKRYGERVEVAGDPDAPLVATIRRVVVGSARKASDGESEDT